MAWFKCARCHRRGEEADAREGFDLTLGYYVSGCKRCLPSEEDREALQRDRLGDEPREGDGPDGVR